MGQAGGEGPGVALATMICTGQPLAAGQSRVHAGLVGARLSLGRSHLPPGRTPQGSPHPSQPHCTGPQAKLRGGCWAWPTPRGPPFLPRLGSSQGVELGPTGSTVGV